MSGDIIELQSCPFCGSDDVSIVNVFDIEIRVACLSCHMNGPPVRPTIIPADPVADCGKVIPLNNKPGSIWGGKVCTLERAKQAAAELWNVRR